MTTHDSTASATTSSTSILLSQPLEIRHLIYSHLCRDGFRSYPFKEPQVPLTAVNCLPPPLSLRLACRVINQEVDDYYYGRAIFHMLSKSAQPSLPANELPPGPMSAIYRMRKVEMIFLYHEGGFTALFYWIEHQVKLLKNDAHCLHTVIITISDVTVKGYKGVSHREVLSGLKDLRGKVRFELGSLNFQDLESGVREEVTQVLEELNKHPQPCR